MQRIRDRGGLSPEWDICTVSIPSKAQRSLQTAGLTEEMEELGGVETAANRCFSDTTEPLSQQLTAAATVGTSASQMQPARIPSY